jgi:hypothetical protein
MFATLALRSIKCVNSNLLGIYNFRLPQLGLIAVDSERPWAIESDHFIRVFCSREDLAKRAIDIELKLYWQRVECRLRCRYEARALVLAGGVQYAVQPYYSIAIPSFLGFVLSDAFLRQFIHSFSWSR